MATIDQLLDDILSNPDAVAQMTEEQVLEARKKMSMYGVVVPAETKHFNISVINWRESYLRRFHLTSIVGYLYRCAAEINNPEHTRVEQPSAALMQAMKAGNIAALEKQWRLTSSEIVSKFLSNIFEYNPDRHLKAAFKENLDDPERQKMFALHKKAMQSETVVSTETVTTSASAVYTASKSAVAALEKSLAYLKGDEATTAAESLRVLRESMELMQPTAKKETVSADAMVPVDAFHNLDRYITTHFEMLRETTQILYAEKPDIEFAIQVFGTAYETEDEALTARNTISDKVNSSVFTISNGGWYVLGPFKNNRDRIDFYNKNTEILKRMAEQAEQDQRLGQDLMKNRVRREKERNIIAEGPDDPGLERYKSALGTIEKLGAKAVLTADEKQKMAEAVREKESAEVPEDAIQVDIHRPVEIDGQTVLKREKFYTKAEAPSHMLENNEEKIVVKPPTTLTSRDGKSSSIESLKARLPPAGK